MTVVVADTSPLSYLVLIDQVHTLRDLFGSVVIPREVFGELSDPRAPEEVRKWTANLPDWIEVRASPSGDAGSLPELDAGERAAILIAQMEADVILLIDDQAGRREAALRNIRITGTLGVLRAASIAHLINLPEALSRLLDTNFRAPRKLIEEMLEEDGIRRSQSGESNS